MKIYKNKSPFHHFKLTTEKISSYATRNVDGTRRSKLNTSISKNTFLPSAIIEQNKLNPTIGNAGSAGIFKSNILRFTKPTPRSFFNCYIHKGIRLMTRLCLELSHLLEHKFNDNFQNCINPLCSCSIDIESTSHFFLHCPLFNYKRISLQSILSKTDCKLIESKESSFKSTTIGN